MKRKTESADQGVLFTLAPVAPAPMLEDIIPDTLLDDVITDPVIVGPVPKRRTLIRHEPMTPLECYLAGFTHVNCGGNPIAYVNGSLCCSACDLRQNVPGNEFLKDSLARGPWTKVNQGENVITDERRWVHKTCGAQAIVERPRTGEWSAPGSTELFCDAERGGCGLIIHPLAEKMFVDFNTELM